MPVIFAISSDLRYFFQLTSNELLLSLHNEDVRGLNVRKFFTNTYDQFIVALYEDRNEGIKKACRYAVLGSSRQSMVYEYNFPDLLLENIANFSIKCVMKIKVMEGCRSCIYTLPSACSFSSENILISGQRAKITHESTEDVWYPINRAVLRALLNEASFDSIEGNKLFKQPPTIYFPPFKFCTHELDQKLAKDNDLSFDLNRAAEITKNDEVLFDSLAALSHATKDVDSSPNWWLTSKGITLIITSSVTVLSLLILLILTYKLKTTNYHSSDITAISTN